MAKVSFHQEENSNPMKTGPPVIKEVAEMLDVEYCIVWIGKMYYEEDGKEAPGQL